MRVLRGVGVLSIGKTAAIVYAGIGLVIGAIFALVSVLGGFAGLATDGGRAAGIFGMVFGVAAVLIFPILYGVVGALAAMLLAALFNAAVSVSGGVELEID